MRVSLLTTLLILLLDASLTKIFDPTALPTQIAETAGPKIFVNEVSGRNLRKTCRKWIDLYTHERCFNKLFRMWLWFENISLSLAQGWH